MKITKYIAKIDLKKLLYKLGIRNIRLSGENFMGSCPFHKDDNPSFGMNIRTGAYNCFSCGSSGNLITLVCSIKNIGIKQSIYYLYNFAGIKRDIFIISSKIVYRQLKKIVKRKHDIVRKEVVSTIIHMPISICNDFIPGVLYLKKRGISEVTFKRHDIVFCIGGFYRNRIIIPIVDEYNKFVSFEARDITGFAEKKVLYPKGTRVSDTIYNLYNAKEKKEVIIVEGIMDTLYLEERGFNVISLYGVNMSVMQEELLSKYFNKIFIAFDGDHEGYRAMIKQARRLSLHQFVYIIKLDKNKDPDSYTGEEFNKLKNNAVEIQSYLSKKILNTINK